MAARLRDLSTAKAAYASLLLNCINVARRRREPAAVLHVIVGVVERKRAWLLEAAWGNALRTLTTEQLP